MYGSGRSLLGRQLDKDLGEAVVGPGLGGGNVETSIVALPTHGTGFVYRLTELILHNPRHMLDSPLCNHRISLSLFPDT